MVGRLGEKERRRSQKNQVSISIEMVADIGRGAYPWKGSDICREADLWRKADLGRGADLGKGEDLGKLADLVSGTD